MAKRGLKPLCIFNSDGRIPLPTLPGRFSPPLIINMILLGTLNNEQYKMTVKLHRHISVQPKENKQANMPELVLYNCWSCSLLPLEPHNPRQLLDKKQWSSQAASCECM